MTEPVCLSALGLVNALGNNKTEVLGRLMAGDGSGMVLESDWLPDGREALVGKVTGELPAIAQHLHRYNCRNNRLLLAALAQIETDVAAAIEHFGPSRVGVIVGTSTSGIAEGEVAISALRNRGAMPSDFNYAAQEIGSAAPFLAAHLGLSGPAYTISTACTSSAKALVSARMMLAAGLCDAVIAGGADSLCRLTVSGFAALESVSSQRCNPMSISRCGINIGEGAALFLVTREVGKVSLLGCGESSDAYHMSAPQPDGLGAEAAMRAGLADANISAKDIGYVNLHGTATPKNDEMESRAMQRVFPEGVPTSSTKPLTGHLLGAAGVTEAAFCWLALSDYNKRMPPHIWDGEGDPKLPTLELVKPGDKHNMRRGHRYMMSNGYAFGGSNVSLILGVAS